VKTFPIMKLWYENEYRVSGLRESIPWDMISPHEKQAALNHGGQSLARLAERGGLSPCEAVAVLEDRKWSHMDAVEARLRLEALVLAFVFKPL
jgi:lambda repressor-like predicted transcriptional regulator